MTPTEKRVAFDRNSTLVPGAGEEENGEEETNASATGEPAAGEDPETGEEGAVASVDAGGQEPTTAWQ